MNSRFWELLGFDPNEKKHLSKEWQDLIHPDDLKKAIENFNKHCENPKHPYDQIVRYRHREGKTIWVRCRGIAIRNKEGKAIRMLGAHNDLTEQKELEEKLHRLATTDDLTGLPNRRDFNEHLEWSIKNAIRKNKLFSILLFDIDHFKNINDTYGHQKGDEVLRSLGKIIKESFRQNDFPSRFGGEEFIILLHETNVDQSIELAEKIRKNSSQVLVDDTCVTVSIGISTFIPIKEIKENAVRNIFDFLIGCADKALYYAKSNGRNQVVHYLNLPSR